jgi:hypothetical protein
MTPLFSIPGAGEMVKSPATWLGDSSAVANTILLPSAFGSAPARLSLYSLNRSLVAATFAL